MHLELILMGMSTYWLLFILLLLDRRYFNLWVLKEGETSFWSHVFFSFIFGLCGPFIWALGLGLVILLLKFTNSLDEETYLKYLSLRKGYRKVARQVIAHTLKKQISQDNIRFNKGTPVKVPDDVEEVCVPPAKEEEPHSEAEEPKVQPCEEVPPVDVGEKHCADEVIESP